MRCEQCHRERYLKMARTERFCTQRCVIEWLREHPDKTPKDAVGDSDVPFFSLPSLASEAQVTPTDKDKDSKNMPRALRNLHIDMAPPGTILQLSDTDSSEEYEPEDSKSKASLSSQLGVSTAKRSQFSQQPPAIKKAKTKVRSLSPHGSSKSVKFAVEPSSSSAAGPSQSHPLPGSISIVSLDKLSEFVKEQTKHKPALPTVNVEIPPGLFAAIVCVCAWWV